MNAKMASKPTVSSTLSLPYNIYPPPPSYSEQPWPSPSLPTQACDSPISPYMQPPPYAPLNNASIPPQYTFPTLFHQHPTSFSPPYQCNPVSSLHSPPTHHLQPYPSPSQYNNYPPQPPVEASHRSTQDPHSYQLHPPNQSQTTIGFSPHYPPFLQSTQPQPIHHTQPVIESIFSPSQQSPLLPQSHQPQNYLQSPTEALALMHLPHPPPQCNTSPTQCSLPMPIQGKTPSDPEVPRSQAPISSTGPVIGFEGVQEPPIRPPVPNISSSVCLDSLGRENLGSDLTSKPSNVSQASPTSVQLWGGNFNRARIFFVQKEGRHVVSPDHLLNLGVYKLPALESSSRVTRVSGVVSGATVILKVESVWSLGLSKQNSFIVRGVQGEIAIFDYSTVPARTVVVVLSKEVNNGERQRLDVLLKGCSRAIDEPTNIVNKVESGVETVFDYVTEGVNSVFKKGTPQLHKTTKSIRKGTGQVVRFGGNLISKGIHLVSDNVIEKDIPKSLSSQHSEIFEGLKIYRDAVNKNKVSKVSVPKHK